MKNFLTALICTFVICGTYNFLFVEKPIYTNKYIRVYTGDTLWDIAARHTEEDEDIREVIFRIAEVNRLDNKNLYPGQILQIPVRSENNQLLVKK